LIDVLSILVSKPFSILFGMFMILLLLLLEEEGGGGGGGGGGSHSNKEDPINVVLLQFQVDKTNYCFSRSEAHHCPLIKIPPTNKHKHETQIMHSSTTVYKLTSLELQTRTSQLLFHDFVQSIHHLRG
jgi:hypothetical protein